MSKKTKKKNNRTVKVHLTSQSSPVVFKNVRNAYTKDGLYCVRLEDKTVHKFPCVNIHKITECLG